MKRTHRYILQGDHGTLIQVIVTDQRDNIATNASVGALFNTIVGDTYRDAIASDQGKELIIAACYEGDLKMGDQWQVALDHDGTLTHASLMDGHSDETFIVTEYKVV